MRLAQLDRAFGYGPKGQGFESSMARQKTTILVLSSCFFYIMQNAMFITYREVLVRSSHITGYLTDAGFAFGEYLKGYREDVWKIKFYLLSILFFIIGGILGYLLIENLKYPLIIVGFLYIIIGFLHIKISDL